MTVRVPRTIWTSRKPERPREKRAIQPRWVKKAGKTPVTDVAGVLFSESRFNQLFARQANRSRMSSTDTTKPHRSQARRLLHVLGSPYFRYRYAKYLHGARVALAMLASIALTSGIDIPHGEWSSVTLLVVIGGLQHHGNIRKKAAERALGTLLGASLGLALILLQSATHSTMTTYVLLAVIAGVCAYHAIGKP